MADPFKGCEVTRVTIERLTVVGPMAESKAVMDHLASEGYRISLSGSYTDGKMFPKCDVTRFKFIAEREI